MKLLDEAEQRWYCHKDDITFHVKGDEWRGLSVEEEDRLGVPQKRTAKEVAAAEKAELFLYRDTHEYDAIYVDGYRDLLHANPVKLILLPEGVRIELGEMKGEGFGNNYSEKWVATDSFDFAYTTVEAVNVVREREITALRTFLIGPVLAAAFKKENRILNVGFRDKLGLLQMPSFKIAREGVQECYEIIVKRMLKSKELSDKQI
jgi:hypothetical protein